VPGTDRAEVSVLEYSNYLKIYHKRKLLGEYDLPPNGVKNQRFSPKGQPAPQHQPKYRKKPTAEEEKKAQERIRGSFSISEFCAQRERNYPTPVYSLPLFLAAKDYPTLVYQNNQKGLVSIVLPT